MFSVLYLEAKNVILAGVKSVTLHDQSNVLMWDLSANFFILLKLILAKTMQLLAVVSCRN